MPLPPPLLSRFLSCFFAFEVELEVEPMLTALKRRVCGLVTEFRAVAPPFGASTCCKSNRRSSSHISRSVCHNSRSSSKAALCSASNDSCLATNVAVCVRNFWVSPTRCVVDVHWVGVAVPFGSDCEPLLDWGGMGK